MIIKDLQKAGLTDKEAKVYLAALELGNATIARLSQKSKVKRSTVYLAVGALKEKGLLSIVKKKNKTFFYAEDPRKIEKDLESKKEAITKAMPEILALANFLDRKPKVKYFEGRAAIKEVFKDMLNYSDQEILAWFSDYPHNLDDEFLFNYFIPNRIKNKSWIRAIAPDTKRNIQQKKEGKTQNRKMRLVSQEKFKMKVQISLYGKNKIGIISYKEEFGMIMESQDIHDGLKSIFEVMWEGLEKKSAS
jgi:sugar-specific transcriptional regulator TrmB